MTKYSLWGVYPVKGNTWGLIGMKADGGSTIFTYEFTLYEALQQVERLNKEAGLIQV